jgi:hypothetical protein
MVSYSSGSKSTSSQGTLPLLSWPESRAAATAFKNYLLPNVYGDTTRGLAAAKGKVAERGAESSISGGLRTLASSTLSDVGKQKGTLSLLEKGASEGAKARLSGMDEALQYFQTLLTGQIGTYSESSTKGGGGGGVGCSSSCLCFKALNEGYLEETLRRFRDGHFPPDGFVDKGYKKMSLWFVPLVERSPSFKTLGRIILLHPLTFVTRWVDRENSFGVVFLPVAYLWVSFWWLSGYFSSQTFIQRTPREKLPTYPSLTSTFLRRLIPSQEVTCSL